jgi:hypothetical protein
MLMSQADAKWQHYLARKTQATATFEGWNF